MSRQSMYVLQDTSKTFCPTCGKESKLLCPVDIDQKKPWFYICFTCIKIFELGKSEVQYDTR